MPEDDKSHVIALQTTYRTSVRAASLLALHDQANTSNTGVKFSSYQLAPHTGSES